MVWLIEERELSVRTPPPKITKNNDKLVDNKSYGKSKGK